MLRGVKAAAAWSSLEEGKTMYVNIQVVSLDDKPRWDALHSRSGIPSHSWAFSHALSYSQVSPQLASVQVEADALIFPFYQRRWQEQIDVCTILSVSGAVMRSARQECLSAWSEFAAAEGWVACYLQFEPETDMSGIAEAIPGNRVFLLDLSESNFLARTSQIVRRKVRRAEKLGVEFVEDRHELAAAGRRLYSETMARSGAFAHYTFSESTLASWILDPGSLAIGAARRSQIEAIATFPFMGPRAEYHIGAASAGGRELTAWLLWQGIQRLRELGVKSLNFGGGVRPHDGVYQFKEKFGGPSLALHAVKQIYQPETYRRLCSEANVPADTAWFPAYRASAFMRRFNS
jgi:hypothetical protein